MQMVAWVSTPLMAVAALSTDAPDAPAAAAAVAAAAAPETIPWGLITNGKKIP